jgi:hypothetical protein
MTAEAERPMETLKDATAALEAWQKLMQVVLAYQAATVTGVPNTGAIAAIVAAPERTELVRRAVNIIRGQQQGYEGVEEALYGILTAPPQQLQTAFARLAQAVRRAEEEGLEQV